MIEIKNRWTGAIICTGETLKKAVLANLADLRGADLNVADLRGADLRGADLNVADLRGADLRGADLRGADLRGANLRRADLLGADLNGADLRGADLLGADLNGADLRGAEIAWQSHDLIAEILKRSSGDDTAKLKVAGFILICREKCWSEFLDIRDPLAGWAIGVLADWVQDGDGAPDCVRVVAEQKKHKVDDDVAELLSSKNPGIWNVDGQ
jgi:hypothetical protein